MVRLWMFTGHIGHKTLRHQKRGTRHFDTSAVIEEKPGYFDPGQYSDETQLPRWFGLNFGTNFVVPKCPVAEVSGFRIRLSTDAARDLTYSNNARSRAVGLCRWQLIKSGTRIRIGYRAVTTARLWLTRIGKSEKHSSTGEREGTK